MFFGSAINNFGLEAFLETFCELMPPPAPRATDEGADRADDERVQRRSSSRSRRTWIAAHRDRVAFVRICSGRFERGMKVHHVRTRREIRLANPTQFMAQERSVVEEGFAGDVIGVYDPGIFEIGDTLTDGSDFTFEEHPELRARALRAAGDGRPARAASSSRRASSSSRRRARSSSTARRRGAPATSSSAPSASSSSRS